MILILSKLNKPRKKTAVYIKAVPRGRAIAQAASRWLPTAAARVRARVWSSGICGGQNWRWGRFSPSSSVSPANLHSTNCSTITLIYHLGLYNRPEVAAIPGDVSPTPQKKKRLSQSLHAGLFFAVHQTILSYPHKKMC
jgi:hypothetical protein